MSGPALVVKVSANMEAFRRSLVEGTETIQTTKREMTAMANAFDGAKIISQSGAVMAQIQALGGVTNLTAAEQSRANGVLQEALDKYTALGREAPPGMQALADATRDAQSAQSNMLDTIGSFGGRISVTGAEMSRHTQTTHAVRAAYSQFDGILQASGVNIGPYVRGLEDIRNIAVAGVVALGPLGTAALVVAGAIAAWKVVTEITKHTEEWRAKIATTTAVLLSYGDVAGETAAAKQDVLNRAIDAGADHAIKYADAIKFVADLHKQKLSDALEVTGQKLADAQREVRNLTEAKRNDILRSMELGASEGSLQRHYGISADALQVLAGRQKQAADMADQHTKRLVEQAGVVAALDRAYDKLMSDVKNANQLAIMDADAAAMFEKKRVAAEGWMNSLMKQVKATNDAAAAETARVTANQTAIDAEMAGLEQLIGAQETSALVGVQSTTAIAQGYAGVTQQVERTADAIRASMELIRFANAANAIYSENGLFTTASQRERVAALPIPGRASGGPVSAGAPYMVGERGPELFVPERSGRIVANGAGSTTVIAPVINFNGPVDSSTDVRSMVSNAILDIFRSGAVPFPASV